MPLKRAKAKGTVSYRPNAHRTENATVLSGQLSGPTGLEATPGAAGSLNDATYTYRVAAIVRGVESLPSEAETAETTAGAGAGSVALAWNAMPNASSYNVYGRTGTIELIDNVEAASFVDDGSETPAGALPIASDEVSIRLPGRTNQNALELGSAVGEYVNRYSGPASS